MEKRMLTVATVEMESVRKSETVALQGLNIKREGGLVDLEFVADTNILKVKYFEDTGSNIEKVIASWGEVKYKRKEVFLGFRMTDVKDTLKASIAKAYDEASYEGYTGHITFNMED